MSIELKNIDLSNVSIAEQLKKYREESFEYNIAEGEYQINGTEENRLHLLEEWWDTIQADIGFMHKAFGITADEIMDYYNKYHLKKIKNRPREKGEKA